MIEFEHSLFILLLLIGLLNAKPSRPRWAILVIVAGVLLVFFPPPGEIPIPWETILGMVIPLLLWQNIRRMSTASWRGWSSIILWGITVLVFSFFLWYVGGYGWPSGLLFGMIVASMIWRASEPKSGSSYMSLVGALSLVFLLTEVDVAIQSPNHYIGGIFSAAFNGLISALFGLYLIRKFRSKYDSWIGVGQVYFAYWISFFSGVSPITAATVSVMAFVWLRQYSRLGHYKTTLPAPLNSWFGFGIIFAIFLLLGWQGHQPISGLLIVEVIVGTVLGIGIAWLGYKLKNPAFQNQGPFWLLGIRISLLLFPALLIWPRGILQQPIQLVVAIALSVIVLGASYLGRSYLMEHQDLYIR
ncbi:MAG: hypothetical protein ABFS17_08410 [Chloroflexota bacterium]